MCIRDRLEDLLFAFKVAKHVKSNAIVYVKDLATAGIGAGQMNRKDSAYIAAKRAIDAQAIAKWDAPVSYTHLDVYKRQIYIRLKMRLLKTPILTK